MAPFKFKSEISFYQHYMDYIRSPAVIVVLAILIVPLLRGLILIIRHRPRPVPDCFRLGLTKRSNLLGRNGPDHNNIKSDQARIQALFTYPIKSCRGIELGASEVVPTGLKYDRLFTFAQLQSTQPNVDSLREGQVKGVSGEWKHHWRFITQREFPRLALIETELWVPNPRRQKREQAEAGSQQPSVKVEKDDSWAANGGTLIVRFPFEPDFNPFGLRTKTVIIRLPLAPTAHRATKNQYSAESLSIWKDDAAAINVSNEIPKKGSRKAEVLSRCQ